MLNGQWGIVNKILTDLGFAGYPWLVRRPTALAAAIVYHVWKYLPFWTLIFVAGRRSIPKIFTKPVILMGHSLSRSSDLSRSPCSGIFT